MLWLARTAVACLVTSNIASAEPFQEVTIGLPVSSITEAEAWYTNLLGADVDELRPVPGIVEFKVSPNVWLQIFEANDQQPSAPVVRFLVEDIETTQRQRSEIGIETGKIIQVPNVVTFSEFVDPGGNALGLYDLP
ncbi:VOC family protein [uncultured Pelagimonas sp.]|uniref:VOC family protein n=1 Tax=uncultured Pelagimonas sp. TaxID=1618102 RepID=UPI00263075A4|nr:VOC family protein [uncultured Pelagimonas sp.]